MDRPMHAVLVGVIAAAVLFMGVFVVDAMTRPIRVALESRSQVYVASADPGAPAHSIGPARPAAIACANRRR